MYTGAARAVRLKKEDLYAGVGGGGVRGSIDVDAGAVWVLNKRIKYEYGGCQGCKVEERKYIYGGWRGWHSRVVYMYTGVTRGGVQGV